MAIGDEWKIFDPKKFFDREAEQEIFQNLIECQDEARLLTICDGGGRGKSEFLKRLHYSVWQMKTPVALIELQALEDPTEFHLIQKIRYELVQVSPKLKFTKFDKADKERPQPVPVPVQVIANIDMRNAQVTGKKHSFTAVKLNKLEQPSPSSQVSGEEMTAREKCITAFFDDVKRICKTEKIVILFDTWDGCNPGLQWSILNRLRDYCFDTNSRPTYLIFVLAGQKEGFPDFNSMHSENYHKIVKSIESFGEWNEDHVRAFLRVKGHEQIRDEVIRHICSEIKMGMSLISALEVVKLSPK